jgi:hypothetical protein
MKLLDVKTLIATILGGIGLLLASVFMSSFFSSPPSRAEYNTHVILFEATQKSIDDKLTSIETNQGIILGHLLETKRK